MAEEEPASVGRMSRVGTTLPTGIDVRRPRDHHQPPLFTLNLIHQGISGEAGIYLVLHALAFCAVMPDDDFTILISCACTTRIWLLFLRYTPKRNALRGFGGDGATDHVPESGTRNGFNPLPTLVPSDGTRIYRTVASSPRAVTDRLLGCVWARYGYILIIPSLCRTTESETG